MRITNAGWGPHRSTVDIYVTCGYNRGPMQPLLACAGCGIDAGTSSMMIQMLQAAAISVPFLLRAQIASAFRAARTRFERPTPSSCRIEDPGPRA